MPYENKSTVQRTFFSRAFASPGDLARTALAYLPNPTLQNFHNFGVQRDVTLYTRLRVLRLDGRLLC